MTGQDMPEWAARLIADLSRRISTRPLEWAEKAPDTPALVEGDITWTYGQLAEAVGEAKSLLFGLGVWPGDRLLVVGENCRAQVALALAAGEMDVWFVPINARMTAREVDAIQAHCQPRRTLFTVEASQAAADHAKRHMADMREIGMLGGLGLGPQMDVETEPVEDDSARQPAVLIYTTGTTGEPKACMNSHRGITYVAAVSGHLRGFSQKSRAYGVLPQSHIFGYSPVMIGCLTAGGCLEVVGRYEPAHLFERLKAGITILQGVPAMYAGLLEYAETNGLTIEAPALEYCSSGGAPMDVDLKQRVEKALGVPLNNGYGMSETGPTIAHTLNDHPRLDNTVGPILPGQQARTTTDAGEVLPEGEVGELWVKGPNVMLGYYRNVEATKEVLSQDGWFRTGDLARIDEKGFLYIVGRAKELIIRSGFNVFPPEVEGAINSHPDVTLSAVVGRTVDDGNEEVVAFVQPAKGKTLTEEGLITFLEGRLAPYKKPGIFVFMDSLPAAPTGKILKKELSEKAKSL